MGIQQRIEHFVQREGRRPRILVGDMDQKNHDHDTKLLAACFAEAGFDVDISPPHQTPYGTARMAIENDVHLICALSAGNNHRHLITELVKMLKAEEAEDVIIIMVGVIPQSEYKFLTASGVDLVISSVPIDSATINRLLDFFE
ncbi:MAG: cobalamin-dependent protein [Desulfobacterales bacterium]|jgi:methylmalonyl-CoA mutase